MKNPFIPTEIIKSFVDLKEYDRNERFENELAEVQNFKNFIKQDGYPCVGAHTSANSRNICFGIFDVMHDDRTTENLAWGLLNYIKALKERKSLYLTYVAIFPQNTFDDEEHFESGLWQLLAKLHELDKKHFDWDPTVSNDPESLEFSYSFGGESFFIVGMHPKSSRKARRFHIPAVAFNLHSQFERLRSKGRYEVMKKAIRQNEMEFQGSINPMLADHGQGHEAKQYSGRAVDDSWECPFKHMI